MWRRSFRTAPHQGTGQLPLVQSRACSMTNLAFAHTAAWRGSRWWPGQRRACAKRSRSCAPCVAEHKPAAVAVSAVSPANKGPSLLAGAAPFGRAGGGRAAAAAAAAAAAPAAAAAAMRSCDARWRRQRASRRRENSSSFSVHSRRRRSARRERLPAERRRGRRAASGEAARMHYR